MITKEIKALAIAPLFPAVLLTLLDGFSRAIASGPLAFVGAIMLGFYVAVVMELFAFLIGLPAIFLLKRHLHSLVLCLTLGGVIAALPMTLLAAFATLPDSASINGIPTVLDGQVTTQWYIENAKAVIICIAFGMLGGATFWHLRRRSGQVKSDES